MNQYLESLTEKIIAKLESEEVTAENFSHDKAKKLLSDCVGENLLITAYDLNLKEIENHFRGSV